MSTNPGTVPPGGAGKDEGGADKTIPAASSQIEPVWVGLERVRAIAAFKSLVDSINHDTKLMDFTPEPLPQAWGAGGAGNTRTVWGVEGGDHFDIVRRDECSKRACRQFGRSC